MTYTITTNPNFNSIEITFDGKPSEAIRNALKELRFRWHNVKKVWYGYTEEATARKAIDNAENGKPTTEATKAEKVNKYGVKVGDLFEMSWGYEQTNVDFFQVITLVGESSVRVREVNPPMIDEKGISGMSADRTYKLTNELLPPSRYSVFIEDQEKGDLKRINLGFCKDPEEAKKHCYIKVSNHHATKCNGDTITCYESWYA